MVHFRPLLAREGISEQQWRVLRTLFQNPGMDATGLARECQVLSSSLTRMGADVIDSLYAQIDAMQDRMRTFDINHKQPARTYQEPTQVEVKH